MGRFGQDTCDAPPQSPLLTAPRPGGFPRASACRLPTCRHSPLKRVQIAHPPHPTSAGVRTDSPVAISRVGGVASLDAVLEFTGASHVMHTLELEVSPVFDRALKCLNTHHQLWGPTMDSDALQLVPSALVLVMVDLPRRKREQRRKGWEDVGFEPSRRAMVRPTRPSLLSGMDDGVPHEDVLEVLRCFGGS